MRHYSTLTWTDRLKIEAWRKVSVPIQQIADELGVHNSTIYRELKRGQYTHLNDDYTVSKRYSPDIAEKKKQEFLRAKGPALKIGNDRSFAAFIERKIAGEKYSPAAALGEIKAKGLVFNTSVTKQTLYRYIETGVFLKISNRNLPIKGKQKRVKRLKKASMPCIGTSIEKRPQEIGQRQTFGHWEMDCVVGKKDSKGTLLVLTERLTRFEIVRKMKDKTAESVVCALDSIEREYGEALFRTVFKSITVDNGVEFFDVPRLEIRGRTKLYYCHPYSSWERGSNENQNRMIRRHYPKGCNFDEVSFWKWLKWKNGSIIIRVRYSAGVARLNYITLKFKIFCALRSEILKKLHFFAFFCTELLTLLKFLRKRNALTNRCMCAIIMTRAVLQDCSRRMESLKYPCEYKNDLFIKRVVAIKNVNHFCNVPKWHMVHLLSVLESSSVGLLFSFFGGGSAYMCRGVKDAGLFGKR